MNVPGVLPLPDGPSDNVTQGLCLGSILPASRDRSVAALLASQKRRIVGGCKLILLKPRALGRHDCRLLMRV